MKANEAPEKIYCHRNELGYLAFSEQQFNYAEEYVNTDAFIEKACDYLQKNLWRIIDEEPEFRQRFVTDFKNYMKGE